MTRRLEPPTTWADIVGALVVAAGVVLAVVRFLGEDPVARTPESFAASVALGAVIAVPGVLCLLAGRTGRTSMLVLALLAGTVVAACAILPGVRRGRGRGRASAPTS